MKKGKNYFILVLLFILLINSLGVGVPTASADSSAVPLELSLPANLTDWVLDENAGYIYAISSAENNLYFIRLSDLKIEKTLNVGSNPSYLARDGQSLQIALSGATMIKTVDLSTQQISNTIITTGIPNSVAATSKYLFYGTSNGVYKYDKSNQTNSLLFRNFLYNGVALAVDESSNMLYVGEISSYAGITAVDIKTGAVLSQDIDDDMEIGGNSISLQHIFVDDQSVYFGGHQFNKRNLIETTGTYSRTNGDYTYLEAVILDVSDTYVLTTQGVYDKETYTPLALFPSDKRFALLDSNGQAYLAGESNWFDNAKSITRIGLTIPSRPTSLLTADAYSIRSNQAITDWTTTDNSPYIYAIMASTNELVTIRKADMREVKKMFIGSNPSKIKILNNKLYILFKGKNNINIMDLQNGIPSDAAVSKITTKHYPLDVYPDNNNRILYYSGTFGGGISVTSAVYTSVTDTVYEKETGINRSSTYLLLPDQHILYGGDTFSLYKYNSDNFDVIERKDVQSGSYDAKLFLDEGSLYFGNRRMDANQTSTLYGTYAEQIIYARGSLVFSNSAVYDRDSFTKLYDLLMFNQHTYVDADHTIFVSDAGRLYKFNNLQEMQAIMNEGRQPSNAIFVDQNMTLGAIDGYLSFEPPANQDGITNYTAYYLDQNGNKLKQIGIYKKTELSTDSLLVYEISHSTLPAGAVSIGVYPVVRFVDYGSERTLDVHTTAPIYDAPSYLPVDFSVTDTNPDINKFSGTVTWKSGIAELPGVRYSLYFINEEGELGDAIAVVNGGQKSYSLTISERNVPEEALAIGIFMENDDFISPFYSRSILEDKVTPDILVSSITIHKYQVQADNIVVNNLVAGDIVRVYNERLTRLLGYGIVDPNKTAITITISNVGNPGEKLLITRQSAKKIESMGTLVIVPPITNDSGGNGTGGGGTGGGGAGGGGTGGGGAGGGGTGGGGAGDGGSTGAVPTDSAKVVTTIKENTDGTKSSMTEVATAFISKTINDPEFKKNPVIIIKADEKTPTQSSQFQMDLSLLTSINNNSKDAVLILESSSGKIQLPVNSLFLAVSGNSGSEQSVIITIAQAASDNKAKLTTQLSGSTSVTLGGPVEYEVKLIGSGQDRILSNFSSYVGHVMNFNVAQDANAVYTGLTYDSVTQTYVPVPTIWEWKDGVLQVTMKRKGNSVYTVVQNHTQFNDLNNSNPFKNSILALANRSVINGYSDGSFKAESVVTRAEFATMLNRALGILPKLEASRSFKDVKEGAWYVSQVNAAIDAGLINGFTDGTFRPNQEITHQEMIVMLVNALKYGEMNTTVNKTSSTALPIKLPDWVKPYYVIALDNGILPTDGPFQFQMGKKTERQESAMLLFQLMKILKLTNA